MARKKRKKQGTLDNPFFPKGELPIMADAIATALRRFGTVFQPHLYIDVRPYLVIKYLGNSLCFWLLKFKLYVNLGRCLDNLDTFRFRWIPSDSFITFIQIQMVDSAEQRQTLWDESLVYQLIAGRYDMLSNRCFDGIMSTSPIFLCKTSHAPHLMQIVRVNARIIMLV
jgi:hypothetical protein